MKANRFLKKLCTVVLSATVISGSAAVALPVLETDSGIVANAANDEATTTITVNIHYLREDGKYDDWVVWAWPSGGDGATYVFSKTIDTNGAVASITLEDAATTSLGFIVKYPNWIVRENDRDWFVDLSTVVSGTVDVYYKSGDSDFTVSYDNAITDNNPEPTPEPVPTTTAIKSVTLSADTYTYDGTAKKPSVTVTDENGEIVASSNYTVTYTNNTKVGTAKVTVKGKGSYTGTITKNFKIEPKNITDLTTTLSETSYVYDGTEKTPDVVVEDGTHSLKKEADYTVSYSDNIKVGTATVTITGRGNYTGTVTKEFTINGINMDTLAVTLSADSYTYDGTAKRPFVTVVDENENVISADYYDISYSDNINAGTATVKITGKGLYTGEITKTFTITRADVNLEDCTVSLDAASYTYDGKPKKPTVTIKDADGNIVDSANYDAVYANNINAGTAKVTITGKGDYTGTVTKNFSITQADVTDYSVSLGKSPYSYDGKPKKPIVTVKDADGNVIDTANYSITYANNINAGTAKVTVTGTENYTGTVIKYFTITGADIKDCTISLSKTSYTYDGQQKKPTVTVKDSDGNALDVSNYKVTYISNTKAGTATVKITGKGNYTGTVTKTFTIKTKNIKTAKVSGISASYIYNGKAKTPTVTVKDGKTTLKKGTHYTVSYKNNKTIGTATITIKGKGSYGGTITKTFKIVPKNTTLKTVTSPKNKQLKATWAKNTTATGYQIQYSTSSKFTSGNKTKTISKNSTTSATITKLTKGKTYYVRVRAYKTVSGKKVYGAYSTVKKVKIK